MTDLTETINSFDKDNPTSLVLDAKHPGLHDQVYVQRRTELFNLARTYRLNQQGFPHVEYTPEEHALWKSVLEKLTPIHEQYASALYLRGKKLLNINTERMPQLGEISEKLWQSHRIGLVPAEGLISTRCFYYYLSQRLMPCTLFLRHHSEPAYTPEPDAIHDFVGHVPLLTDPAYADLIEMIGEGVKHADEKQLTAWGRIYWFTIEFSLIEEKDALKIFGAGLFSSYGEMVYAYSDEVTRKPFNIEEIIETDYDNTQMQKVLFVIPSLQVLKTEVQRLLKKFDS